MLKGSGNPTDEDLAHLRAQGFTAAISLLEENKQPPRYDKTSAHAAGWSIYSLPIEEGCAPSLQQICDFTTQLKASQPGTKVLVFCESGLGRTYGVYGGCLLDDQGPHVARCDRSRQRGMRSD
jgi:protein tyrosine phosphatase (PTP) superfamily phosphohydrolase (DUF442 family)